MACSDMLWQTDRFEKGGTYNLNVQSMTKSGLGLMRQQLELLKKNCKMKIV
jgi:exonuclease VII large subunit